MLIKMNTIVKIFVTCCRKISTNNNDFNSSQKVKLEIDD